jgi:hypothetical protein
MRVPSDKKYLKILLLKNRGLLILPEEEIPSY